MSEWNVSSEPVEAVLFDLGNTLVSYYKSAESPRSSNGAWRLRPSSSITSYIYTKSMY